MRIQRCKGSRDLSPEEMIRFRLIEDVYRERCLKWGYKEVRTPTLEYLHLFTSTGTLTPKLLSKVYSFLDWDGWSGERVVLRPDGTIPVARLYIDSMKGTELAKLFYVANVFIFEETGKKARERWQCGAELIGVNSPLADVELIMMALEVLARLKLEGISIKLSHAGLIKALLVKLGLNAEEQTEIFNRVLDGDVGALARIESGEPELDSALSGLLNLKGEAPGFLKSLKGLFSQNLPELESSLDDFINIVDLLEALGCHYHIDMASGRGFEYYTGVIFQFFANGEEIGGGGRYNALIPLIGGEDIPASGFALYLDRLMTLIKPHMLPVPEARKILVRAEPGAVKQGFDIADNLRQAGYTTELSLGGERPTDYRWTLDVQSKEPEFILTDGYKQRKYKAQAINEILTVLGKESVDKDSAT